MKILLVEDEKKLAEALKRGLEIQGFTVDIVADGKRALMRISLHRTDYDVVILDLNLPSMNGDDVCKHVRADDITLPILILTAQSEIDTKVKLLTSGADDYLVKPFSFDELNARIHALLRRPTASLPQVLRSGDIELDPSTRRTTRAGRELSLTLKEYGLLEYFLRHQDQVVNREDLLTKLWDFNYMGFSNIVDVHVKNLRRKLQGEAHDGALETVRGIGYRWRTVAVV